MIEWLKSRKPAVTLTFADKPKKPKEGEENNSEEDSEENNEMLEIPVNKSQTNKIRSSVSAEAYGLFHKKGAYTPKVVPKTQEQKERIIKRLGQAFMFQALDEREKDIVVNAMEEKIFK